jgi:hypothetical protein
MACMRLALGLLIVLATLSRAVAAESPMERKLHRIVLDHVEFEEITLDTAISFLKVRAKALDPDGRGVNFLLLPPKDADTPIPTVTIMADDMPLDELIRYLCLATGYQYRVEEHAVVIAPPCRALDAMQTRTFPLAPGTADSLRPGPAKETPR